ncbi:MAG TPA: hypothetical protein PKJ84_14560 [Anaerolineales bacterium]|nr:hypothetical protein [Anaerolineales bacterium]
MDKFISINVNQGDAFYLERNGVKILVDGGKSRQGFANQFTHATRTNLGTLLDIVVCTHADADHINGLLGFYESGHRSREIWLPGTWTYLLTDLLLNPEKFFECLYKEIYVSHLPSAPQTLEELSSNEEFTKRTIDRNKTNQINQESVTQAIEESQEHQYDYNYINFFTHHLFFLLSHLHQPNKLNLFIDAIDTAKKIRDLAILAYRAGADIRWFEISATPTEASGGESHLKPINSHEILRGSHIIKPHQINPLLYLTLSKSNKECLVFHSPGANNSGCVLFTGDSDLSFPNEIPSLGKKPIITAPHHGSESNKNAYEKLNKNEMERAIFVRSDGKFKSRPGISFKSLQSKICTLCPYSNSKNQTIIFTASVHGWRRKNGLKWCKCE